MEFLRTSATSEGWHVQWEVSHHQGKRQSPVAWVAFVEETKRMKPTDKAIHGMVSESSGRKASEPRSGLVKKWFRRPNPLVRDEACMACRRLAKRGVSLRRGGRD